MIRENDIRSHYKTFHHIFLYITERCQLRCNHCYMGSRLDKNIDMPYEKIVNMLNYCSLLGAQNITLVGGEPTLHQNLSDIVDHAYELGFDKIYIDTNGLHVDRLKSISPEKITYVRVSLDGPNAELHDQIRGKGTYNKTIKSIKELVKAGHQVSITSTVFQFNICKAADILPLADELGVSLINYHVFSEEGRGATKPYWSLAPYDWIDFYEAIEKIKYKYRTSVWYPPTWATSKRLKDFVRQGYRGCLGCTLDRLSIFPDGTCYVCSVLFDKPLHYGTITNKGFLLNTSSNEFELFTGAIFSASDPWLSGCPAEKVLEEQGKKKTPSELISICRCWKSQVIG